MSRHFLTSAIWLLPLVATVPLFAQPRHDHGPAKHTVGAAPVPVKLHVRLTTLRPRSPGDSVRAKRLTRAVRNSIGRYADVRAAERDGYRLLFAGDTSAGQVLHYSHIWRGVMEGRRLDPVQPGSLLYEKQRDGTLATGTNLDDCACASRLLDEALEASPLIPGRFDLEVSSPGLERRLRTLEDFKSQVGHTLQLKFQRKLDELGLGAKTTAELIEVDEASLLLKASGKQYRVQWEHLKQANDLQVVACNFRGFSRCRRVAVEQHHLGVLQLADSRIEILADRDAAAVDRHHRRFERLFVTLGEDAEQIPPSRRNKRHPLALALDDQPHGHALDAAGRELRPHLAPQERRDFVTVEPVANVGSAQGVAAAKPRFEPLDADEVQAFKQALASSTAALPLSAPGEIVKSGTRNPMPPRFEDTEIDEKASPLSGTQYGDLN
mgnify:CR=1 FL=1